MNFRFSRTLFIIGSFVTVFLFFAGRPITSSLAVLIVAATVLQSYFYCRCPHCNHWLDVRDTFSSCCKYCGKPIQ